MVPADLMKQIDAHSIKLREQGVDPEAFRHSCIEEYFLEASKRRLRNVKHMDGE